MDSQFEYIISTQYLGITKFIFLNEITLHGYLEACNVAFDIQTKQSHVQLLDNNGSEIPKKMFENVIRKRSNCGVFVVHLNILSIESKSPFITVKDIKEFLIRVGARDILNEGARGGFTVKTRRQFVRHITDFAIHKCGLRPTEEQKFAILSAVVRLYPFLNMNVMKGYFGICLRNQRATEKKTEKSKDHEEVKEKRKSQSQKRMSVNQVQTGGESTIQTKKRKSGATEQAIVDSLKATKVSEQNMNEVKQKLILTAEYRSQMMKEMRLNILESFPYFFTHPTLILFDFAERYPMANDQALITGWSTYRVELAKILKEKYNSSIHTEWSADIQELLILIKLIPAKANGKNRVPIQSFNKSIEKFIVFRTTDTPVKKMIDSSNNFPYIIAVGHSAEEISHFYIEVEKELIPVPEEFNVIETFDLFLKVHYILGLNFHPNIAPSAKFCLHFIYKINLPGFRPTIRMKELDSFLNQTDD